MTHAALLVLWTLVGESSIAHGRRLWYNPTTLGPIAQRQSDRLITGWFQVRILVGPPVYKM